MIHLDRISRRYGPRILFEGLSWLIPRGARVGLVGPNGAGKTTLLRILSGDDPPDAGEVRKAGAVTVGYLPQEIETLRDGSVLAVTLEGFAEIRRLEIEIEALAARLASLRPGNPEADRLTEAYGTLRHRFESMGGDGIESRARAILTGLGVGPDLHHVPLATLSGGWRMRVALARLLLGAPDLLLLDEPTNHLDLEAIDWLERFLASYDGAFVVVSHDRYFLNRMVDGIVEMDRGSLTHFKGNYDDYLVEREAREAAREEAAKVQAKEIARVERFIERFRYKATKARQVQARVKALEKVERIEAPGARKRIRFGFPPAPRSGDIVARAEGVRKAFGDNVVYSRLELLLRRGDRVALVGPNGAGKSTLLKLLSGRLLPDSGALTLGHNVIAQYYAQHQLEALDPQSTVLGELERSADAAVRPRLRSMLGAFLFSGDDVDKPIGVLSGGEKARVALAKMLLRPSNLLLLDEPTNHLDLRSREVLEDALEEYAGTLVVISHDRYFINRVATSIAEIGGGGAGTYPGDYDAFLERHAPGAASRDQASAQATRRGRTADAAAGDGLPSRPRDEARELKRLEAEERNRRHRVRKAREAIIRPLEDEIEHVEERIRQIVALQAEPASYRDPEVSRRLGRERAELDARLAALYDKWEKTASAEAAEDAENP